MKRIRFTRHALERCAERDIHPPLVYRIAIRQEPDVLQLADDQLVLRRGARELVVSYDEVRRLVITAFWR